jgi:hypothetical protein
VTEYALRTEMRHAADKALFLMKRFCGALFL